MNKFTPEQEERLKNFTEKEKDLLKNLDSAKIDTFVHITENNGLNFEQRCQVIYGLEDNFSEEQVSIYAKPEFDEFQMEQIRTGFESGLSVEQVGVYAKPEFNEYQMREIRCGFNEGLSIEQVSVYAKPEFTCVQMSEIESGFKKGLSIEQISMYAKPEFYDYQMNQICRGFKNGLSMEQVSVYAKPEFNTGQMRLIEDGFRNKLSMEQVKTYAKPEFDSNQMWEIENGLDEYKLSIEQVGTYAKPEFDFDQMFEIRRGFINGLSMEQVGMYAKPELSANQIYAAMNGLRNGISTDKINDIINSGMSPEEMSNAMFNEVKKDSTGVIVYRTAHKVFENYYSKTDAFICRTETEAIDLIKEKQLNDYQNQQNYSYSYKVVGKNGDLSKAIREDQRVILAPSYDIAKNIKAEATVEAEYGDECLEGTMVTLAHHGPRSNNPAPCNTPDVPELPPFATVVVSHIDLDTLGGIYALQGRKPEDYRFWEAAEMIDVKGAHHIHELDKDIQDKLNAYCTALDKFNPQKMNVCPTCETLVYLASGAKDYASNKNTYAELVNRFSIYPKLIYNLVFIAKAKLEIVGNRLYIRKKQDVFYIDFNLDDVKLFHNNYCQTARDNNFTDNVGGFHEHPLINTEPSERFKEAVKQVTKYKYEEAKKTHEKKRKKSRPRITFDQLDNEYWGFES